MAIYHLDVSHVSKAKGGSASAKNDYIEREGKYAKDAQELVVSGHDFMPNFCVNNPRDFWRAADEHERKNAQVCSEIRVALPIELSAKSHEDLVKSFIKERLTNQPCTWAIHRGDDKNPHAHIMYSARTNEPSNQHDRDAFFKRSGAKKNRDFIKKDWLISTREEWAKQCNNSLEISGSKERVDHRTLDTQCRERLESVEKELERPEPRLKVVERVLQRAAILNREPQTKKYRKRPKRRFWHRTIAEPEISLSRSKKKVRDPSLTVRIETLKSRVFVALKNMFIINSLTRTLAIQREQKERIKEADEARERQRTQEAEKRRQATLARKMPESLSRAPKIDRKGDFGIGY